MKFVLNQITGKLDQVELNNISNANAATLTDDSMADTLHRHSELSASDGIPDRALVVDALGNVGIGTSTPTVPLDVSCSAPSIPVTFRNTNAAGWAGFNFFDNAGALKGSVVYENMSASVFPGTVWIANRGSAAGNDIVFATSNITERVRITKDGNVGIGTSTPTAVLHLKAGTATAGTAPLKLTSGINLTTPEAGVIEFDGTDLFITI